MTYPWVQPRKVKNQPRKKASPAPGTLMGPGEGERLPPSPWLLLAHMQLPVLSPEPSIVSVAHGLTSPSCRTGFLPHMFPETPGRICFWERQSHCVGLYFQSKPEKHVEDKCNIFYDLFAYHFPGVSSLHIALHSLLKAHTSMAPNSHSTEVRDEDSIDHGRLRSRER